MRRPSLHRVSVRAALVVAALAGGCSRGVRSGAPTTPGPRSDALSDEWVLEVDSADSISVEHVENLLRRAGIAPTTMGAGSFAPRSWGFQGDTAKRAREVLRADASWPQIEARQGENFSLLHRLEATPPVISDSSVEAAIARLAKEHPPAAEVLRDPKIVRFGDGPSSFPGRSKDELLVVASMRVLDRTYVGADGGRLTGCEVQVEMRTQDDRWGREWVGEVLSDQGKWRLDPATGAAGDRRPRR